MALTPRTVFRYFETDGVPASGNHKPIKAEIIQLLEQLFGTVGSGWVVEQTLAALNGVTPENESDGGVVLNDPDPANNGYYYRDSAAWVKGRGLPDTFAKVALSGSGTAQTGAVDAGVNPADVEVFFAVVGTDNTGAMTLAIGGEAPRSVVNLAGNPLAAGEWTGVVMFFLNGSGQYQLLIDAGAAASAAHSASSADADRIAAEIAAEAAEAFAAAAGSASGLLDRTTVAALIADNVFSYTAGSGKTLVAPGAIITAQGFRYEVAANDAVDAHVETAGGVKLKAIGKTLSPEAFGVVGGAVDGAQQTLNTAALRKWLTTLLTTKAEGLMLSPLYEVNGRVYDTTFTTSQARLVIRSACGGSLISYEGSAVVGRAFEVYGHVGFASVSGLDVDGNGKAGSGIAVSSTYGRANMFARHCNVRNLNAPDYTVVNEHHAGIRFQILADADGGYGGIGSVKECSVDTMTKDTQSAEPNQRANQAIVVVGFERSIVKKNEIENVQTDDTIRVDADGIVVFSRLIGSVYQPMTGEIAYNVLKNCAGRFIKLQADGVHVHHNIGKIEGAFDLIDSFRGIDSQIGSATIEDNEMTFGDEWTSLEPIPINLQSPSQQPTKTKRTKIICRRNKVFTAKQLYEGVTPLLQSQEDITEWIIEDNEISWIGAGVAAAVNSLSAIRYPATSSKKFIVRYRRNRVAANNLILQTASSGAGDKSDMMELDVEFNENTFGTNFIFSTSSNSYTSNMLVRGNNTGGGGGNRVQQAALDLAKLKAGCNFRMGAGTITNGPGASLNNNNIEKVDNLTIRTTTGTSLKHSDDNGATWAAVALS